VLPYKYCNLLQEIKSIKLPKFIYNWYLQGLENFIFIKVKKTFMRLI